MNKKKDSRFSLSDYSLITQIIIINIIIAFIGLIFFSVFNFILLNNNKNIQKNIDQMNQQIINIKNYLEQNAIIELPLFNKEGGEIIFSSPQLDPYVSQLYLENQFLYQSNEVMVFNSIKLPRIYNSELKKYVDTRELLQTAEVIEVDITTENKTRDLFKLNKFFEQYKDYYLNIYNTLQRKFDVRKMKEIIEPLESDSMLIINTIKKGHKISKIFFYENNTLLLNILYPLIQEKKIHGIVFVRGLLTQKNDQMALISFNLFNLYLIMIFFMFLLSIIFTKSIIRPIKILSLLTKAEQDKFNPPLITLNYPIRSDEIGGLSDDVKNMSKELKSQINELEKFSADVAHELKNPLASLKTSNELLAENKITSKDRQLLFSNIIKDIDRMNRLISDILDYTRTHAEVEKQKFNEFELINFINDLIISFLQNNKKIRILFDFNDSKITVQANMDKLAQVFINLIENAISFSPEQSNILIQQVKENDKVIIYIIDQGCGVNEKLKDKIFERFYTDRQNKNDYHTGLGLSISKKIMKSLGGSLELSDKIIDKYIGACFKLELPIKA